MILHQKVSMDLEQFEKFYNILSQNSQTIGEKRKSRNGIEVNIFLPLKIKRSFTPHVSLLNWQIYLTAPQARDRKSRRKKERAKSGWKEGGRGERRKGSAPDWPCLAAAAASCILLVSVCAGRPFHSV